MSESGKGGDPPESLWSITARFSGFGLTWALSTLLFFLAGWWLDQRLGTMPILAILGAFVGGAAGFYYMYYHIVTEPMQREHDEER